MMISFRSIIVLCLMLLEGAASLRVPTPYYSFCPPAFVLDATASSLWNSTQSIWNITQEAYARLRQHHPPHPQPSTTDDVRCTTTTTGPMGEEEFVEQEESLTEYLSRLEDRLAHMEEERLQNLEDLYQQQQQLLTWQRQQHEQHEQLILQQKQASALQHHQPSTPREPIFAVECIRIFFVTAIPVISIGALLGLSLMGFTHLLGFILEWSHPFVQTVIRKSQMVMLISAQFVVDILEGRSFSSSSTSSAAAGN